VIIASLPDRCFLATIVALLAIVAMACGGGISGEEVDSRIATAIARAQTEASTPLPDIGATISAGVAATIAASSVAASTPPAPPAPLIIATPTPTPRPTATKPPIPTPVPTATVTPTLSPTPTPTATPTLSPTPTPTATPTPEPTSTFVPTAVAIASIEMSAGATRQFEAVVTDDNGNRLETVEAVWIVEDENAGSITPDGLFTAGEVSGSYEDSVAVRLVAGGLTATATITIIPASLEHVIIEPNPAVIGMGMDQQFVAMGADQYGNRITDLTVRWSREGGGTLSAGGLYIAGSEPGTYTVTVKAMATQVDEERSATTNITVEPDRIAFLSDRDGEPADIYIMNADGTNVERVTRNAAVSGFSWSQDGRRLVYSNVQGIFAVDDGGTWTVQISKEGSDTTPSWSPDGRKILIASGRDDNSEIYVMDLDGGNQTRLTNDAASDRWPTWSPNGEKIAFVSDRNALFLPTGINRIWVMDTDGANTKILMLNPGQTVSDLIPNWSPGGNEIAYQSAAAGGVLWRVKVTGVEGLNTQVLSSISQGGGLSPGWTEDGEQLVFASYREENQSDIYIMDRNGANTTRLTTDEALDTMPRWAPRKRGVDVDDNSIVISNVSTLRSMTVQDVAALVGDAVVRIETDLGSGSGFVIASDGEILTNNHVITDAEEITVLFKDGSEYTATVLGRDMVLDLAVLSIEASGLPTLRFGDISQTPQGAEVVVAGYPLGTAGLTITKGLVSAVTEDTGRNIKWIQTDSAVNPGNSGGPLLDLRGRVVGVVSAKFVGEAIEGVGFAISVNTVKLYLERIKDR